MKDIGQLLAILIFIVLITSCSDRPAVDPGITITKENHSNPDTIHIKGIAAIFYKPDAIQWTQIRFLTDTAIFESQQHECFYQQRNSRDLIEKLYPPVNIVEVNSSDILLFTRKEKTDTVYLNKRQDPCGLFLFNGLKKPIPVDMTNIETELRQYFQTKSP